ncbi:hypothetical protein [Methyloversatilis sp. XJ19-13]|uniref:hypothetical protein n=1 Tax=Methyloversatilis sp. XJ19-13 TaxID=2963430 RepID=UPI00211BE77C|nr:hypothetical protein [Methyloversatilis sp. XJ19-13]
MNTVVKANFRELAFSFQGFVQRSGSVLDIRVLRCRPAKKSPHGAGLWKERA